MRYIKIISILIALVLISVFLYIGWLGMDVDGDGLVNGTEQGGWDITVYYANGTVESRHVYSSTGSRDTDGDGLSDSEEFAYIGILDPSRSDTDGDGLSDYDEIKVYGTSPNRQDSEIYSDGLMDGIEINGWNITVKGNERHVTSDPFSYNTDGDELSDYDEWNGTYGFKTDPSSKDTDGDGISDGSDVNPLWNIKIKIELLNFTLTSSPSNASRPYFYIRIGGNVTETEKLPSMVDGDREELDGFVYTIDVNDYKDNFPPKIEISAFDNITKQTTSTIFGTFSTDAPLNINGSTNKWSEIYDYPNEEVISTNGTNGILTFRITVVMD